MRMTNARLAVKLQRDLERSAATLAAWTKVRDHMLLMALDNVGGLIEIDVFCTEMQRLNSLVAEFEHDVKLITADLVAVAA